MLQRGRRGFTILELTVAVSILGILALIAMFTYQKNVVRARESRVQAVAHTVQMATEMFQIAHSRYPADATEFYPEIFGGNIFPENPFTGAHITIGPTGTFSRGNVGYTFDGLSGVYVIEAYGNDASSGPDGDGIVARLING